MNLDTSEKSWNRWVRGKIEWDINKIERGQWASELILDSILPCLSKKGFMVAISKHLLVRKFLWFWKAIYENSYEAIDYINGVPVARMNSNIIYLPSPKLPITFSKGSDEYQIRTIYERKYNEFKNIFDYNLDYEFWNKICNYFEASPGAFDDTWTGSQLRTDLANFFWAYIDLKNSSAIKKYEEEQAEVDAYYKQLESSHLTLEELDKMRKRGEMDPDYVYDKHE
jgi:hypothetical protein